MADYTQPDVVQKRVRFFDGQFLQDQDFIDEQKYHLDRERRQSKLLRVTGITEGLTVTTSGTYQVTVTKGMAVDSLGRHIVLTADMNLQLAATFAKKQNVELHLIYQEAPTDVAQTGGKSARRWDENPKIAALAPDGTVAVAPDGASSTWDGPTVLLARLAVSDKGDITVDGSAASKAGLSVPGVVGIGTTSPAAKLEISGGGGVNVDLLVNGRLRSNNNDGGLWVAGDRFVGGHSTNQIGFWNGNSWRLTVQPNGNIGVGTTDPENADGWNKVVDILGSGHTKLSLRTANIDARVLAHDSGFFGSPSGMIVGTKSNHALSFATNAAARLTVSATGNVGIGATNPGSDLEIGSFDARNRYLTFKVSGGNQYRSGVKLWAWQENYGYSVEYDERGATGNGLHIRAHDRNADGTTRLFVGWNGNIGIGTTGPEAKLAVSASTGHLQLRRENTETTGGKQLFLELYQHDPDGSKLRPEVFPSIRFHHNNRFWHRIEAQTSGFHFKDGNLGGDGYSDIRARNIYATGTLEVTGSGGTNVDLLVGGRLRSNNNDGGLWVTADRFVGGFDKDKIGFWTGTGGWQFTVQQNGNVGIGTTTPGAKLTVRSGSEHLQLRRENTETTGGKQLFLELYQHDPDGAKLRPEVFPSIRFHHNNRFWHRIEAQTSGFHFKDGNLGGDGYSDIQARTVTATALHIGSVTIGEGELAILKKLAAGALQFDLYNVKQDEYAYAADYSPFDNDRRHVFTWRPKGRINQGRWRIDYPS